MPTPSDTSHSFWQHDFGDYTPNDPLRGDQTADVAIIGAGFTGLTTAREILKDAPGTKVVVVDMGVVGFGASGRNGGFNMTLFGLEPEVTLARWGREKTLEAVSYMQQAVTFVKDLAQGENLSSDYEHTGMLRVAYSPAQLKRLRKTYELLDELSPSGTYQFLDEAQSQADIKSPRFVGAIQEENSGILNPCKHVRELKRLAQEAGALIYENTPVSHITKMGTTVRLETPRGNLFTERLVIATNAWSHMIEGLPKIKKRQRPTFTYQVVTEPLTDDEWARVGWSKRQSFEDNRQMVHYLRRTKCGRITIGGGAVVTPFGSSMAHDEAPKIWNALTEHLAWLFPALHEKSIAYRWGGPVSVNLDLTPEIGFIGDERIIYSTGCLGHGVSLTQLNGRLIADLVQDKKTALSDFWIVNRKAIAFPPEPFAFLGQMAIQTGLNVWDSFEERSLRR